MKELVPSRRIVPHPSPWGRQTALKDLECICRARQGHVDWPGKKRVRAMNLRLWRFRWSWLPDWLQRAEKREQNACGVTTLAHTGFGAKPPTNARTTSRLRLMQASTSWTSAVSYDHLFASEQTPSLHLKIDNEGALGNVPSTPTKKTSTNLVFARNMPTKRGRWGREREREREREGEREREMGGATGMGRRGEGWGGKSAKAQRSRLE